MLKKWLPCLIFLAISFLLVVVWFKNGNTLGAGETGNPFYNPSRMVAISAWSWGDQVLGGASGLTFTSALFWVIMTFLFHIGIPGFILQAGFLFLSLFVGLAGMYLLTKEIFPKLSKSAYFCSSLFFIFNPFALMNIWNRFLLNTILFYSFLPLLLYFFMFGLRSKNLSISILISFLTVIFSFAFAAPAQTLIFWGLMFFTAVFYFALCERSLFVIKFFILSAISWLLFNFWWIFQQISFRLSSTYATSTSAFFTGGGNFRALISLSDTLGQLKNSLLMLHGPFFTESTDLPYAWPLFYTSPVALALQWTILIVILLIAIRNLKNKWVFYVLSLFILGLLFSKGISSPLGELFSFMFQKISLFNFFRNPFEKIGILIPFAFAPLFGYAINELNKLFFIINTKASKVFLSFAFLYLFVFMGFPFWTRLVFSSGNPPANDPKVGYEIKVPAYYKEANDWLKKQGDNYRFISFPIGGEGIFNTWEKGYAGIELSGVLFETPNLSYNTTIPYYHEIANRLEEAFMKNDDFYKVASLYNVRFILIRDDIDYKRSSMRDPSMIKRRVEELSKKENPTLKHVATFGKLDIYEISPEYFTPRFAIGVNIITSSTLANPMDISFVEFAPGDIFIDQRFTNYAADSSFVLIKPKSIFYNHQFATNIVEDANLFPAINRLPSHRFYMIQEIKEEILKNLILEPERKAEYISMLLGKRVKEAEKASEINDLYSLRKALNKYKDDFSDAVSLYKSLPKEEALHEKIWRQGFITSMFSSHDFILEKVENKSAENVQKLVEDVRNDIKVLLLDSYLKPKNKVIENDDFSLGSRVVYQFDVFEEGEYEFLIEETNWDDYFVMPKYLFVQVDDVLIERDIVRNEDGYLSLGLFTFDEGIHELGFNIPDSLNLLDPEDELLVDSATNSSQYALPIRNFDPYSLYHLQFDYTINTGSGFAVFLSQNIDATRKGEVVYRFGRIFTPDRYDYEEKKYSADFIPSTSADNASILFTSKPWNNCEEVLYYAKNKCRDEMVRRTFDRPSRANIKNIKVTKHLKNGFLRGKKEMRANIERPIIDFAKINQTRYEIDVKNANDPYILVFSELFDSGWMLKGAEAKHIMVNGFANAWAIDKQGDYKLTVEFANQEKFKNGVYISSIFIFIGFIAYLYLRKKENNEN